MRDYSCKFEPSYMQKLTVKRLKEKRCYGNWCGTGAGKTISALLASRELDLRINVIICPNSNKEDWKKAIDEVYPKKSNVVEYNSIKDLAVFDRNVFNYIIFNFDKFSFGNDKIENMIDQFLKLNKIDFLCIDEIHFTKQGSIKESNRRRCIKYLRIKAEEINPDIYVLGMTATPIINSISEGKSLIELITCKKHNEINKKVMVTNCIQAHKSFITNGLRYLPDYGINVDDRIIKINGVYAVEDIARCKTDLEIENILLDKKLNNQELINELTPGTILYTQYKKNIINKVVKKLNSLGISFLKYTGDESYEERNGKYDKNGNIIIKGNKQKFIDGEADILLASSPISTGVNGLQEVSNKIVVISYPWTGALWEQLVGRINRQGSAFGEVKIIHPHVYIKTINGEWNYDERRWNIINSKKTLSDVVVDGNIHNIIKINKIEFVKKLINELKNGLEDIKSIRNKLTIDKFTETEYKRSECIIKDIHRRANTSKSENLFEWFKKNPDKWKEYHKSREISKTKWEEDPVDIIANEINRRNDVNVVCDMGCGLGKLSRIVEDPNKVISIDMYSEDENVIKCDMKNTPLNDCEADITVFCLSLWCVNYLDYIKEAYRITAKKGFMYLVEPNDYLDFDKLKEDIKNIGFDKVKEVVRGKFTYFMFIKN